MSRKASTTKEEPAREAREAESAAPFEEDLRRLETIVRELESGSLPLEDAFRRFEEGVRLAKSCRSRLETIEGRIAELLETGETRTLTPSGPEDED